MQDPSFNYSYTPTVEHRESNLYREEYYSSTDTKIYFDDEEQKEIGYIQYEIQEQLKPVYGYNSRTFDDVVIGNRIVTGTFTMPIKNKAPQEFEVIAYGSEEDQSREQGIENYNASEEAQLYDTDWFGSTIRNTDRHDNTNINSEYLTKLIALGYDLNTNTSTTKFTEQIKKIQQENDLTVTGYLNQNTKNIINKKFDELNATPVTLTGATGYDDLGLTRGERRLEGNGLILNKIRTNNEDTYKVMDDYGRIYYINGALL